jgi:hypothetical protein
VRRRREGTRACLGLHCRRGHGVPPVRTRQHQGTGTLARRRHLRVRRQGMPCGLRALRGAAGDGRADQGASRTSAPTAAFLYAAFFRPHPPASRSHRPLFWHSQELATTHADKVRTCRLRHQPAWALWQINLPNNAPRVQPGRRTGGRMHYACATTACIVHPSAVCARTANPHAHPLFPSITCRTPSGSVAACGGLHE